MQVLGGKLVKTQESVKVDLLKFVSEQPTSLKKSLKFKRFAKSVPPEGCIAVKTDE